MESILILVLKVGSYSTRNLSFERFLQHPEMLRDLTLAGRGSHSIWLLLYDNGSMGRIELEQD